MNNHFKVKSVIDLEDAKVGDKVEPSDFATVTPGGKFVQLEYIEEAYQHSHYDVNPGIFTIVKTMSGLKLESTSFSNDKILPSFSYTKTITQKIDLFFSKLSVYKKYGIEVPKRATLLYGPPGGGKTSAISEVVRKYSADPDVCIIVWPSDKVNPVDVKEFIKSFRYVNVERLILVIEDIGGIEVEHVKLESTSSLLSLLDNQEKTFTKPVAIIATTNHPEAFLANITQRPGRFDDKIEIPTPEPEERADLYRFFATDSVDEKEINEIKKKEYKDFTPAHIKEVFLRSDIFDLSRVEAMRSLLKDVVTYKNFFQNNKGKLGISSPAYHGDYDD